MPKYPFRPSVLDALPEELAELFRGLELKLLEEICSRLKVADQLNEVTVQDIRALRAHGVNLDEIRRAISKTAGIGEKKLNQLLDDVVARNQRYYTEMVDLAQVTMPDRLVNAQDIEAIRRQTVDEFTNITQSMGFVARQGGRRVLLSPAKAYRWALDAAELQIMSGAISYQQSIEDAVMQLAAGGLCVAYDKSGNPVINRVAYDSGHIDHLDVAVRRAVMTATVQISAKYREQSVDYLETDLVETTAHLGARNTGKGPENHESWQGRWFRWSEKPRTSKGNYPDFVETTGYGTGKGLCGWNCKHNFYAVIEGVSEPTYSEKDLESMKADNHKFEFEGKTYDGYSSTQKQREIERTIRKWKRMEAGYKAAGMDDKASVAADRLRVLSKKYREFSEAAGLPEQRERMEVLYT